MRVLLGLCKEVVNFLKNLNVFHITNKTYNLKICDFCLMYVMCTQLSITEIFTSFPGQVDGPISLHNKFPRTRHF